MSRTENRIEELIRESIGVKSALLADVRQIELIQRFAASIIEALKRDNKVIFPFPERARAACGHCTGC